MIKEAAVPVAAKIYFQIIFYDKNNFIGGPSLEGPLICLPFPGLKIYQFCRIPTLGELIETK